MTPAIQFGVHLLAFFFSFLQGLQNRLIILKITLAFLSAKIHNKVSLPKYKALHGLALRYLADLYISLTLSHQDNAKISWNSVGNVPAWSVGRDISA